MSTIYPYLFGKNLTRPLPNRWDWLAFILVCGIIFFMAWTARQMSSPYHIGQNFPISLSPWMLPKYAALTVLRMFIAMICSLIFTFIFATWAAKSKRAGAILIPCINILQSVPVLGFLSITVVAFISLFPGSRLGPECASIFAIFTSQVWNMALSFYQSLRSIPSDLSEAASSFQLSAWQRFWRLEVPYAMPGLLWNTMMSMSGGWVFLIASEAISVNQQSIMLPGIGSYLSLAIQQSSMIHVVQTIIAMLVVIFIYDQVLFRPLVHWSQKFVTATTTKEEYSTPWLTGIFQRTYLFKYVRLLFEQISDFLINNRFFRRRYNYRRSFSANAQLPLLNSLLFYLILSLVIVASILGLMHFLHKNIKLHEIGTVFIVGCYTGLRVLACVVLSSIIWVPIGVWIGLKPRWAATVQPLAQFLAAFPANVVFPLAVIMILRHHLNSNIWLTPLMMMGTQWYILFNVIAGTTAIPKDLHQASENFGVKGILWWKRLILPAIFPFFVTGALTAVGGAWNASIIAEAVNWGKNTLTAQGLGEYIANATSSGNFPHIALGIAMMMFFVLVSNYLIWRPLYNRAQNRYRLD